MPYSIRKLRGKPCVKVFNRKTKRQFSKCTTMEKAKKQLRLLNAIHYNKKFVPYSKGKETRKNHPL
jgi:hypothetical protein